MRTELEEKQCGDDGCDGSCGTRSDGTECLDGACVGCQPTCTGAVCGDDGCGGSCGTCPDSYICVEGGANAHHHVKIRTVATMDVVDRAALAGPGIPASAVMCMQAAV